MYLTPGRTQSRLLDAPRRRLCTLVGHGSVDRAKLDLAPLRRPFLRKPVFIGVTGSVGGITVEEVLVGLLSPTTRAVCAVGFFDSTDASRPAVDEATSRAGPHLFELLKRPRLAR